MQDNMVLYMIGQVEDSWCATENNFPLVLTFTIHFSFFYVFFCKIDTVALSFVFDKYYLIID